MTRRAERVAPPPGPNEWDLRFGERTTSDGWEQLCSEAPGPARAAWTALRTEPRRRSDRQHPLKGSLGSRFLGGRILEQWQYEVTGAGRIWYCIDEERRTVYLTLAKIGHPARTG